MTFDNSLVYIMVFPVLTVLIGIGLFFIGRIIDAVGDMFRD